MRSGLVLPERAGLTASFIDSCKSLPVIADRDQQKR
jgi:hypothetical protein